MKDNDNLLSALAASNLFQEYERAFTDATGLPVVLRPVDAWHLPLRNKKKENPFCATMAQKSNTCSECMQVQQKLSERGIAKAVTLGCAYGLCDTVVPIRVGNEVVAYLQTGQVFLRKPGTADMDRALSLAANGCSPEDRERLKQVYLATRVVSPHQYESMVKLLEIFAEHLSILSNRLLVQTQHAEPVIVTRAKDYISQNYGEDVTLAQVARAVNSSPFYFCKMFKRSTGINFTEYLSRVRIEKAKNLLLNPNWRVSEIAFEVGFQSLTHFNRVFKRIQGQAPTKYRGQLAIRQAA